MTTDAMDFTYIEPEWPDFTSQPTSVRTTEWERQGDTLHEVGTTRTYDADGKQTGFVVAPTGNTKPF